MIFDLKPADMDRVTFFGVIFLVIVAVSPLFGIQIFQAAADEPLGCAMKTVGGSQVGFKESTCEERKLDVLDHPKYSCNAASTTLTISEGTYSGESETFALKCVKTNGKELYFDIAPPLVEKELVIASPPGSAVLGFKPGFNIGLAQTFKLPEDGTITKVKMVFDVNTCPLPYPIEITSGSPQPSVNHPILASGSIVDSSMIAVLGTPLAVTAGTPYTMQMQNPPCTGINFVRVVSGGVYLDGKGYKQPVPFFSPFGWAPLSPDQDIVSSVFYLAPP